MRLIIIVAVVMAFVTPAAGAEGSAEAQIQAALDNQVAAWNRGDIAGYMAGFWHNDKMRYVSGGTILYGWEPTLARYQRRYDTAAKRGVLKYADFDIRVLSPTDAFVFCTWHLARDPETGGDIGGAVTKLMRKIGGDWKVVHNHVAS